MIAQNWKVPAGFELLNKPVSTVLPGCGVVAVSLTLGLMLYSGRLKPAGQCIYESRYSDLLMACLKLFQ